MEYTVGTDMRETNPETNPWQPTISKGLFLGHLRGEYVPQEENEALRHSNALSGS